MVILGIGDFPTFPVELIFIIIAVVGFALSIIAIYALGLLIHKLFLRMSQRNKK